MRTINIGSTVNACLPRKPHTIVVITRGATASLNFDLFKKVYTIDNIEQVTFTFRQDKTLYYYNMFEYFKLTADTVAKAGKEYFNRIDSNRSLSTYKFELANVQVGESVVGCYERTDLPNGQDSANWQIEEHFAYDGGTGYSLINFMFTSSETKMFKLTTPDNNVEFEVTIRLDTDQMSGMHNKDSIIVEPQHPIAIIDSLYSKIDEEN